MSEKLKFKIKVRGNKKKPKVIVTFLEMPDSLVGNGEEIETTDSLVVVSSEQEVDIGEAERLQIPGKTHKLHFTIEVPITYSNEDMAKEDAKLISEALKAWKTEQE